MQTQANAAATEGTETASQASNHADLIAAARAVRAAPPPAEGEAETDDAADQVEGDTPPAALPTTAKVKAKDDQPPKPEDEPVSKGLLAINRMKAQLLEQGESHKAELAQRDALIEEARGYIAKMDEIADGFEADPVPLCKALGAQTPEQLRRLGEKLLVAALGRDKVPKEFLEHVDRGEAETRLSRIERENRELKESLAKREQDQQRTQAEQAFKQSIFASVAEASAPHVYAFAKQDPGEVADALYQHALAIYQETGKVPAEDEVVASFEQNLADEFSKVEGLYERKQGANQNKQQGKTPPGKQTRSTTRTLSNTATPASTGGPRVESRSEEDRIKRAAAHLERAQGRA